MSVEGFEKRNCELTPPLVRLPFQLMMASEPSVQSGVTPPRVRMPPPLRSMVAGPVTPSSTLVALKDAPEATLKTASSPRVRPVMVAGWVREVRTDTVALDTSIAR
ncbi:MAG: hypothetical protein FWF28_07730, partial [Micrococcales bacterium]|nr:hypothetical protein [Micrococcales bacterium]